MSIPNANYNGQKYIPHLGLGGNPHLQTIIPSIFRKVKGVAYTRERIFTPDHDFLDLDWSLTPVKLSKGLIIISHGLEGDSKRQYVQGMVNIFNKNGYDCLAWNFRGSSGEINKNLVFYHSGSTYDLDTVVKHAISKSHKKIFLIGFSLGGNLTLKYLGEQKHYQQIQRSVVFSVPLDLLKSAHKLTIWQNWVYSFRFIKSLKNKIRMKAPIYPKELNLSILGKIKTIKDFDEQFTSKLHGFINAEDYYAKNSSIIFVEKIGVPTLIVNASNDPFLTNECYPVELLSHHPFVTLEIPDEGGHCGFLQKGYKCFLWSELRALDFITGK